MHHEYGGWAAKTKQKQNRKEGVCLCPSWAHELPLTAAKLSWAYSVRVGKGCRIHCVAGVFAAPSWPPELLVGV